VFFLRASIGCVISHLFFSVREFFAPEARIWLDLFESDAYLVFQAGSVLAPVHLKVSAFVFVLDDDNCALRQPPRLISVVCASRVRFPEDASRWILIGIIALRRTCCLDCMNPRLADCAGLGSFARKNAGRYMACIRSSYFEYSGFELAGLQDIDSAIGLHQGSMG
jgi:hypothetical protein